VSRVVSITPAALDSDSRTLKEAISFHRFGHESVVVEAVRSANPIADAPIEVVTLRSVGEALADAGTAAAEPEGSTTGAGGRGRVEAIATLLGRVAGPFYFLASWTVFNLITARRLPRADLYWLHGYEQALAVWLRRRPYVYDAHDFYASLPHDGRPLSLQERATHAVRSRIERACVRRARSCVTTSATMARLCEERFGRPFAVVRNAQDQRIAVAAADGDVRHAAGVSPDSFLLVMVGHRKPGTVLPQSLPAGVEVAIVGEGYREATAAFGIHLVGPVAPEQVSAFIATADAAVLFYVPVSDNSPAQLVNGLFHAVGAGLPLLYPTGMRAIADLSRHHRLGVGFDPGDPATLAPAIDELRAGLDGFRASVRRAAQELSWEHEETELARLLNEALG